MSATVIEFPRGPDICAQLRQLAEDIENGLHGETKVVACVMEAAGDLTVFGFGQTDLMRLIGLFTTGAMLATTEACGECE